MKKPVLNISLILGLSVALYAQQITGNLVGRVIDPDGQPLADVNIIINGENLQGTRGTTSDTKGYFRILNLPPGRYDLSISHIAHHDLNMIDVRVELGKTTALEKTKMIPRALQAPDVIIYGEKPDIDPVSTQYGDNIASSYFEQLPVSRSYKEIASVLPQVNASYYNGPLNFAGSSGGGNKFFVDGVDVTDPLYGFKAMDLPYNFIREVEVKTGGYAVDMRSSLGGLVNVITHSGSNEFHGNAFGFYTSNQLSSNSKLSTLGQGDFYNYDAGFGFGGPFMRDRLWFYAAYNPVFYNRDVEIPGFGIYVDKTRTHKFALKINGRALDNFNVVFTTTGDLTQRDHVKTDQVYPLANPDPYLEDITEGSVNYSLNGTYTINNNILIRAMVAKVDRYDHTIPATERGKTESPFYDNINVLLSGGSRYHNNDAFRSSTFAKISAIVQWNQHTFNAGADYKYNYFDIVSEYHFYHRYIDMGDTLWVQEMGEGNGEVQSHIPSLFVQDSWRILDELILTAGLRWEDHSIIDASGNEIQNITMPLLPHGGFVFVPNADNRQRIYGSFRRFSHEYAQLAANFNLGYEKRIEYDYDPMLDPGGGILKKNVIHPILPEQKKIYGQYFDEYSLGYERVLGWNLKASVQGVYRTLGEAIEDIYYFDEDRVEVGNPGRGILAGAPIAQRDYKALVLSIERSVDARFNFIASYVLSKNYGNYDGLMTSYGADGDPEGRPNRSALFNNSSVSQENMTGPLSNDRTHVFKFSGSYDFPTGLTTGIFFIAQSGTPLSVYDGGRKWGLNFLEPRGSQGRTPVSWDLNARVTYDMTVFTDWNSKLILDVFHIGNPQKTVYIDQRRSLFVQGTVPNPNYGQVKLYQPSMSVRLGMEVSF